MATIEELERRIVLLEQQVNQVLPNKVDAVAYGLSLVHADTQAIRGELGEHREMLAEILRRLPTSG